MDKKLISRREFSLEICQTLLNISCLLLLGQKNLFARIPTKDESGVVRDIRELSKQLVNQKIGQQDWQVSVDALLNKIDLQRIIQGIDLGFILNRAPAKRGLHIFPLGKPLRLGPHQIFKHQLFILKKGHSIVPHGHNYMTSAFLVLKGNFRGRHYERIHDEKKHLIIEPSIDQNFAPGGHSTISDERDNVHWFQVSSDHGVILNVHIKNLLRGPKKPGRVYINPLGENIGNGCIRAERISRKRAYRLFG